MGMSLRGVVKQSLYQVMRESCPHLIRIGTEIRDTESYPGKTQEGGE